MKKYFIIIILLAFILLTLNSSASQEIDNTTDVNDSILKISNDTQVLQTSKETTHIDVSSKTNFDVIGDYFKVKLTDNNDKPISNVKITFTVNTKNYNINTDSLGIASLQLRLDDGSYKIVSKFSGNSKYKASSLTTTITMSNTRVVDEGLNNFEIQKIIDNAKANNIILFRGKSYSGINLVISKSLTLLSNVETTLKSTSSKPVITIKGKNASLTKVKGFNIKGDGDGIKIDGSNYISIVKNDISTKHNGIISLNTKYLNITKNNIKNSKNGILIVKSSFTYIFKNDIVDNDGVGIGVADSNKIYIHDNKISENAGGGINLAKSLDGVKYGKAPSDVYINKNSITKNHGGIIINDAGDNININSNIIHQNKGDGLAIANIGSNKIQSNIISDNNGNGIKFFDNYVKPNNQDISYNVIFSNHGREVEAKETFYQDTGNRLDIGDNWYSDYNTLCPKIKTNNIKFVVKQVGKNQFQASFIDSKGNIASLLPDRTLSYTTDDGNTVTLTVSGGIATFAVDADDGDIVKATVDYSQRDNTFNGEIKQDSQNINGKTPEYSYPSIPNYQIYEDIEGNGNGGGNGGDSNMGNGDSNKESSDNTGNSTQSHKTDPANSLNNPNNVAQNYNVENTNSPASASKSTSDNAGGSVKQSVVKQILIDEDEFFKVTGISFIILIIILTIGFYYRDDIREMKSKL